MATFAVRDLAKSFGGVQALKGVDLKMQKGEIHALLGANGAGKSTLIKCLGGAIEPDSGEIILGDSSFDYLSPTTSLQAGVSVIYQEFSLVPTLTVAENVFLGAELKRGPLLRRSDQRLRTKQLLSQFDVDVKPDDVIRDLPIGSQQLVEIVKALRSDPHLLILDEPTASLTESEAEMLASHLKRLRDSGLPILYVTHLLKEVFDVADRVTILREGMVVTSAPIGEVTEDDLVEGIVGRRTEAPDVTSSVSDGTSPVLQVRDLISLGIGPIDLDLYPGEILGVFGLLGSGRTELLESLFGVRELEAGEILLGEESVTFQDAAEAIAAGIALVPEDRLSKSLFSTLNARDNVLLPSFWRLATWMFRRSDRERREFDTMASRLELRPPEPEIISSQFSGGNQQKLSVGRWVGEDHGIRIMLLDEPTQGIDIGTRHQLYGLLRDLVQDGKRSAIVTSSDPDEMRGVADRVVVLYRGRAVTEFSNESLTEERLLHAASGLAPERT